MLLLATRLPGKRVAGQMSVLELTVIVTLGAAIGVPLESPERGLVPALIVLAIAVVYQRLIGRATFSHRRAVAVLEGAPSPLIRDGVVDVKTLAQLTLSRERLFLDDDPPPGLSVLPGEDEERHRDQFGEPDAYACRSCGLVVHGEATPHDACPHCHAEVWETAARTFAIRELRTDEREAA